MKVVLAICLMTAVVAPHFRVSNADAMQIAHAIGTYEGYFPTPQNDIEYEATDPSSGRPMYPGYITIQLRNRAQMAIQLSINKNTGQVADFLHCMVFEYPVIRRTEKRLGLQLDSTAIPNSTMVAANGCDNYRVLMRSNDEKRNLRVYSADAQ